MQPWIVVFIVIVVTLVLLNRYVRRSYMVNPPEAQNHGDSPPATPAPASTNDQAFEARFQAILLRIPAVTSPSREVARDALRRVLAGLVLNREP